MVSAWRTPGRSGGEPYKGGFEEGYMDWYRAQNDPNMTGKGRVSWLYDRMEMHQRRAQPV